MEKLLLNCVLVALTVTAIIRSEASTMQRICVRSVTSEATQDLKCVDCSSVACIVKNAGNLTEIMFASEEFELEETLHIENREGITLSGNATLLTRIMCNIMDQIKSGKGVGLKFSNVRNISLVNITLNGCGIVTQNVGMYQIRSALFFSCCTHVKISTVTVQQSLGSGLTFINTNGEVFVEDSTFKRNGNKSLVQVVYVGGVNILFDIALDNCDRNQQYISDAIYYFTNCNFLENSANFKGKNLDTSKFGRGGGMGIVLSDTAAKNTITLTRCKFLTNTALWGAGMHVQFIHSAQQNRLIMQDCHFENNTSPTWGGGAMNIIHRSQSFEGNEVIAEDTRFFDNSAHFGGGIALYTKTNMEANNSSNAFTFRNCSWRHNRARFGSAMDVFSTASDSFPYGFEIKVLFIDCCFIDNSVVHIYRNSSVSQYREGKGALTVTAQSIQLEGTSEFYGNNGTAVYMVMSTATLSPDSTVIFENNTGFQGGAIALIGISAIVAQDNSRVIFRNNSARIGGGAIYYYSVDQHEVFKGSAACFIRKLHNDNRNISFIFEGNKAKRNNGVDIRASTIKPCSIKCKASVNTRDPVEVFKCIGHFKFTKKIGSVSTLGRDYALSKPEPLDIIPGKEFLIPFVVKDDFNNQTYGYHNVQVMNKEIVVDPAYTFIADQSMKLYGEPGETTDLVLSGLGIHPIIIVLKINLVNCPPGFYITKSSNHFMCTCSANTKDFYEGITYCDINEYCAFTRRGIWIGYEESDNKSELYTAHCPSGYCFQRHNNPRSGEQIFHRLPGEASRERLDRVVCGSSRTGIVCGKCRSNRSVYYHTYHLFCGSNNMCEMGWIFYVLSELLPLTAFFLVVMYFDISFTSGAASGLIFFAQVTDSLSISGDASIWLEPPMYRLTTAYRFIYRFFNFDYFSNEVFAFCLIKGATALDMLAFKYVTVIYALMLIFVLVFLLNYCSVYFYKRHSRLAKHTIRKSYIHGLSAFLIMCYTQCIRVSFLLLLPTTLRTKGGKVERTVVFWNGELNYMSKEHLAYALPAIACLIIAIILPALLIIYPLHYRVIAILQLDDKQWFRKISKYISLEKFKPLLDSFQSCFKDNCRFFAGLFFLYRFLLLLTFTVGGSYTRFYAFVEIQLIIILAVHAYVKPYQKQMHNIIDTLVITNLALINAITLLNYALISKRGEHNQTNSILASMQLILVYLPPLTLFGYTGWRVFMKIRALLKRENQKTDKEETEELEMPARLIYGDEMSDTEESSEYQNYEGNLSD